MNALTASNRVRGLALLRRLTGQRSEAERCELCATVVPEDHSHLVDPQNRRLICACQACSILFDESGVTQYRRVPRDVWRPSRLSIPDELWNSLSIPIDLVFFFRSSVTGAVTAIYPSPAGPTESRVEPETWTELAGGADLIRDDVEALLVNRTRGAREYYIAPIDECYKLTGLIRRLWEGFSGGEEVWDSIREFFDKLERRAVSRA